MRPSRFCVKTSVRTLAVVVLLAANLVSAEPAPPTLAGLEGDAARVGYCYYLYNLEIQRVAKSNNPAGIVALSQQAPAWQAGVDRRFTSRRELTEEVIKAKTLVDSYVQNVADPARLQAQLYSQSKPECRKVLAGLANYQRPTAPAAKAPVARQNQRAARAATRARAKPQTQPVYSPATPTTTTAKSEVSELPANARRRSQRQPAATNLVKEKAKGTVEKSRTATEPCPLCLPADAQQTNSVPSLYTPGFFAVPWSGRFHWDWHNNEFATVRTQGTLQKDSGGDAQPLVLRLSFDSKITQLCVGKLREVGRSVSGYIVHFRVDAMPGRNCTPKVNHAYLYPLGYKDRVDPPLRLVLYAQGKLIAASFLRPPENSGVEFRVQPAVGVQARLAIEGLEARAKNSEQNSKTALFRASAEYPTIEPLYRACMNHKPNIFAVIKREPYCQCVSEKVGIGGRIPAGTLQGYVNNFGSLVARLHGVESEENKLYYRLGKTCKDCSDERWELEPYCSGPDTLLYVATNYAEMIRLLENSSPKIEATDFYKKVFYRTYLQGYSAFCEEHIQDPVPFEYTVTETTVGGWNHGNQRVIQRDKTLVERSYARKYGRYYDETKPTGSVSQGLKAAAAGSTEQGLRQSIRAAQQMLETERQNRAAISQHLQQGCTSGPVVRGYARLLNLVD